MQEDLLELSPGRWILVEIAPAVARAAMESGVATRPIKDFEAYHDQLARFVFRSGMLMKPITMEGACRRCHSLSFDKNNPSRQVPHGDPKRVVLTLEEYYSRVYLENTLAENTVSKTTARKRLRDRQRVGGTLDRKKRLAILKLAL